MESKSCMNMPSDLPYFTLTDAVLVEFPHTTPSEVRAAIRRKSSHLYLYSAFNNTDCVKALNSIKLEDRVSVMYNNKIKHSIFS